MQYLMFQLITVIQQRSTATQVTWLLVGGGQDHYIQINTKELFYSHRSINLSSMILVVNINCK